MNQLSTEVYDSLIEEVKEWKTEMAFNMAQESGRWMHAFGEIVRRRTNGDQESITPLLTELALHAGRSERTLWRYVDVYDKIGPDYDVWLEHQPDKISIHKFLNSPKEENHTHTYEDVVYEVCECGSKRKKI